MVRTHLRAPLAWRMFAENWGATPAQSKRLWCALCGLGTDAATLIRYEVATLDYALRQQDQAACRRRLANACRVAIVPHALLTTFELCVERGLLRRQDVIAVSDGILRWADIQGDWK